MLNIKNTTHINYAFFDLDETIISTKSMMSFIDLYFNHYANENTKKDFHYRINKLIKNNTPRTEINSKFYENFKGFPISRVKKICQLWFDEMSNKKNNFYNKNVVDVLKKHQLNGTECVFISGSFQELIKPIAEDLNVKHTISNKLENNGFTYSGKLLPPQTIGEGKAEALLSFSNKHQIDLSLCFAYGDDISDAPMLNLVGNPTVISGEKELEKHAQKNGWKILQPN